MRVKDMHAGVEYATCDGVLVIPEEPIQRGWMEWVPAKDDEDEGHHVFHDADELDPWGGCMDTRRPPEIGVLVRAYHHTDRDGNKIGPGSLVVMNPRDIKGLWADFMVLHGETVRTRAVDRERNETVNRLGAAVRNDIGGMLPYAGTASVDFHYGPLETSGYGNDEYVEHVDVSFKVEPEELVAFLKQLGITAPNGLTDELIERHRTDEQWEQMKEARAGAKRSRSRSRR